MHRHKNELGESFKLEEARWEHSLTDNPEERIAAIRVDGRAFHSFTKAFERPFDDVFMAGMDAAAYALLNDIDGSIFAYVQSDEITVAFQRATEDQHWPYGGRVEKLLTTSASLAAVTLLDQLRNTGYRGTKLPSFDSRIAFVGDRRAAEDYLYWRRLDAQQNAIGMAARSILSHKQLRGMSTSAQAEALKGTPYEVLPAGFFNGRLLHWERYTKESENPQTGETVIVQRRRIANSIADRKAVERFWQTLTKNRGE